LQASSIKNESTFLLLVYPKNVWIKPAINKTTPPAIKDASDVFLSLSDFAGTDGVGLDPFGFSTGVLGALQKSVVQQDALYSFSHASHSGTAM
jgi:hypothetical protein